MAVDSKFRCSLCGNVVTVKVSLSAPPTCNNPKHKTNPKVMEVV